MLGFAFVVQPFPYVEAFNQNQTALIVIIPEGWFGFHGFNIGIQRLLLYRGIFAPVRDQSPSLQKCRHPDFRPKSQALRHW